MTRTQEVTHDAPIWRDRSDFVIGIGLDNGRGSEQLFARRIGPHQFEICCIPFFTYGLTLGDVVRTDDNFNIIEILQRSGRRTFRVWFGESFRPREEVARDLAQLGALLEWSSVNLLAVDASDPSVAQSVLRYLEAAEQQGSLLYEDGE